jgi:hypothetical protein
MIKCLTFKGLYYYIRIVTNIIVSYPHRGSNKTYLSLKTLNQAMEGKFPNGTDLQTNLSRKLTKKWNKDLN